jgi:hypothetical protein
MTREAEMRGPRALAQKSRRAIEKEIHVIGVAENRGTTEIRRLCWEALLGRCLESLALFLCFSSWITESRLLSKREEDIN